MESPIHDRTILIAVDEPEVRNYLEVAVRSLGYAAEVAHDTDELLSLAQSIEPALVAVLLDLAVPGRSGADILSQLRGSSPDLPIIAVSADCSTVNIVSTLKSGATDFISKPVSFDELRSALERTSQASPTERVTTVHPAPPVEAYSSRNARMQELEALLAQIASSETPVLIQGETGSGKEVIARKLHALSPRSHRPFLKLNCAALPSELVESELFGYERGAFTGAFQRKAGMFEMADNGTLLLDEIGDMDVRLQAKLLQVLQDREFQRIGGKEVIQTDVYVIAATHRDLETAITEGLFREDLYYRLNVLNILLPPLRDRREDILPLAEFLMRKHCHDDAVVPPIALELQKAMIEYSWPGNVRELENFARRFLILRETEMLTRELLAKAGRKNLFPADDAVLAAPGPGDNGAVLEQVTKAKEQAETNAILAALASTHWNRKRAASLLRIDYKALLYKMKKLGIEGHGGPAASSSGELSGVAAMHGD
jgi:two-component system response regulator AtoC